MYKFDELDTLIDHLLDDEIQAYDLPYYMEPMLEDISFVGLLEAYLEEAIAHKNADRIEGVLILAGKLGEDKKAVVPIRKLAFGRLASQPRRSCGYN